VISCTLPPAANIFFGQVDQDISWFGTVRGRFGWTNAATLFYVTGGWAFGRVTTNLTMNLNSAGVYSATFTDTKSGWTAGGGIEMHLAGNWSAKAEYLYVDLGSIDESFVYTPGALRYVLSSDIRNHIFRIGVNYRFGAPVVAGY